MSGKAYAVVFQMRDMAVAACCVVWLCLASCGSTTNGIRAGDDQNGKSITLHPGQTLVVTLSSTYWTFQGSSNLQVLAPVGTPVISQGTCPPGVGCGTIAQTFRAVRSGTARVTASRVSCGEAMRCTGSTGTYQLTVEVTKTSS